MSTLTARATRCGGWWAVEVDEIPGLFAQVRRLEQVEAEVQDAAAGLTGDPAPSFTVEVVSSIDGVDLEALSSEVRSKRVELARAEAAASEASRRAVATLRAQGLPVRDVAQILGVTPQRVSQIRS